MLQTLQRVFAFAGPQPQSPVVTHHHTHHW
jgi:hypothetical protein